MAIVLPGFSVAAMQQAKEYNQVVLTPVTEGFYSSAVDIIGKTATVITYEAPRYYLESDTMEPTDIERIVAVEPAKLGVGMGEFERVLPAGEDRFVLYVYGQPFLTEHFWSHREVDVFAEALSGGRTDIADRMLEVIGGAGFRGIPKARPTGAEGSLKVLVCNPVAHFLMMRLTEGASASDDFFSLSTLEGLDYLIERGASFEVGVEGMILRRALSRAFEVLNNHETRRTCPRQYRVALAIAARILAGLHYSYKERGLIRALSTKVFEAPICREVLSRFRADGFTREESKDLVRRAYIDLAEHTSRDFASMAAAVSPREESASVAAGGRTRTVLDDLIEETSKSDFVWMRRMAAVASWTEMHTHTG